MKIKDKIKNIVHPISKDEQNKLLWWLKRNKDKLENSSSEAGTSGGSSSSEGTTGSAVKAIRCILIEGFSKGKICFIGETEDSLYDVIDKIKVCNALFAMNNNGIWAPCRVSILNDSDERLMVFTANLFGSDSSIYLYFDKTTSKLNKVVEDYSNGIDENPVVTQVDNISASLEENEVYHLGAFVDTYPYNQPGLVISINTSSGETT